MCFIPIYIFILFTTILVDYFAGIALEKSASPSKRKLLLFLSCFFNIGFLAFFKYWGFLAENLNSVFSWVHPVPDLPFLAIILPIGLSFHTFQSLSYIFEVYHKRYNAEKHLGYFALYVMYYPQLVAGPIERPQHILPQLKLNHSFHGERFRKGIIRMLWGLFKKVVISNQIAHFISPFYADPSAFENWQILGAVYLFSVQIYCDFSGYCDIALGASSIMGITLMENFNVPYAAKSIREFWARWHISLSTWFRDYLFIPLGGSKTGLPKSIRNIIIVFLISGLWHGANWTFIAWGALHGSLVTLQFLTRFPFKVLEEALRKVYLLKAYNFIRFFLCFHVVSLLWIFFRVDDFSEAFQIIEKSGLALYDLFSGSMLPIGWEEMFWGKEFSGYVILVPLFLCFLFEGLSAYFKWSWGGIVWTIFAASTLITAISIFGLSVDDPFIYFQF